MSPHGEITTVEVSLQRRLDIEFTSSHSVRVSKGQSLIKYEDGVQAALCQPKVHKC